MKRLLPILLLAGLLALSAGPVFGQGNVKVTGFTKSGSSITLTLQNTTSVPATPFSTGFRLEASTNLGATSWATTVSHPPFVQGPPGFWSATFTQPGGSKYFFRAVGILGTAGDPDGDGLSDTLEGMLGTNPNLFDTDFDGCSDGVEFAYGSNALLASSKPVFPTIPTVNFVLADSKTAEGITAHQEQIKFDGTYLHTGVVNYAISTLSNTVAGTDYTLDFSGSSSTATTGAVSFSNQNSRSIPIFPKDDANVSGQRVVIVDLTINGNSYFIGGRGSHVVLLNDNDSWWTGTLVPASGEVSGRSFRVKVAHQQGGTVTAVFGAGAGNDGLPIPVVTAGGGAPAIGATSVSTAMFPAGTYPGTGVVDSTTQFHVDSPVVSIGAGSICNQPIRRQVVLNAQPSLNRPTSSHSLLPGIRYVGDYTETLTTPTGATLAILPGSFILMRDIPAPLPVLSQLVP